MATLKEIFINTAHENIQADLDINDESWQFDYVMREYGDYFVLRRANKPETLQRTYNLVKALFPFLFPELGGSRSDYLASAIGCALYDKGISLTVRAPKEVRIEWIQLLYNKSYDYEVNVQRLIKLGLDLRSRKE